MSNHDACWYVLSGNMAYGIVDALGHMIRFVVYPKTIAIEVFGSGATLWSAARRGQTLEEAEKTLDRALPRALAKLTVVRT